MKTLLVCTSVSHGNTRRVARAMAEVLDARVAAPDEVEVSDLPGYDLVGFGSGVFSQRMHRDLLGFVRAVPRPGTGSRPGSGSRATTSRGPAFVFATSGLPELAFAPFTRPLVRLLEGRGFAVVDTFTCRALDTWMPFRLIGGINKQRPDEDDLVAARAFARRLGKDCATAA
ncbi:flavodoxin family protein [Streptomyces sp. NBC_01214]|uniref:flavodoxin family protein n=1 Tax=Streptomyces sp. NBC_01214 TaxID=2903777 RepID=UPI00224F141E|nr:flavodoxin family protein [Streptomyces sp. NBC_01214]MCX4808430.1 flavodoxin family protein [Streptomyces sp. NBC_01214]